MGESVIEYKQFDLDSPNLFQGWIRLGAISILIVVVGLMWNGNVATANGDFTSVVDKEHDERGEWSFGVGEK
jgi:hypothetical protein